MDKAWMSKSRLSVEYEQGVREFLEFAFSNTLSNQILCPCQICVNSVLLTKDEVYEHLIINGILKLYKNWYEHGEQPSSSSNPNISHHDDLSSNVNVHKMLQDTFGISNADMRDETSPTLSPGGPNNEASQFFKLLEDANKELKHSQRERHYQNPFMNWKKVVKDLGLDYKKIDACPNDCMLYWKEATHDEICKQPNLILSLLIPSPRGPGNDIDVYLQPLIDELKNLSEFGVGTYDAHTNQSFEMKAALLWTLSDFPGYAMLSGWSTKGRFACPYCNKDTCLQSDRKFFNGPEEFKVMPNPPSATQILKQLEGFQNEFGKGNSNMASKRRRQEPKDSKNYYNWKKKSIFFELPYWEHNLIRHNLYVMHIEKNVCDSFLGTLLNIVGKSKDTLKALLDLCEMNIRANLHPVGVGNKMYIPPTCYTMNKQEREKFCTLLKNVRVPDGYSSNISHCVNHRKIEDSRSERVMIVMCGTTIATHSNHEEHYQKAGYKNSC
ncbi:uncharacterized protein LOC120281099 [Dioscorea cayenensis subsp. rotundata]|uniref:Uncharacterized protein LOC120281099 n=1 Tax=Dioscorea cayennensis subsp. rotundata TaxID=55577 RepID=A0AB40CVC8_DIOCR|nr:uncharacterized protein LOC120281099 [Dioscorea cayenensis subsp. rotundata]